jgi:TrmH family RNA methyltransferase
MLMISSLSNPKVKLVRRLQADRRFRARRQQFVVEGTRWLKELESYLDSVDSIFYTQEWLDQAGFQDFIDRAPSRAFQVSGEVMAAMSSTETSPGIAAVINAELRPIAATPTFLLILDQISNPGNLGTILRTAAAAGADGVLLTPGSVDIFNPKVVRGSMGAVLRLPVRQCSWTQIRTITEGMSVWIAAADGSVAYTAVNWQQTSALIIGNEAHGAGQEAYGLAEGAVSIPMSSKTESLNAAIAAGIILFEVVRQRSNVGS